MSLWNAKVEKGPGILAGLTHPAQKEVRLKGRVYILTLTSKMLTANRRECTKCHHPLDVRRDCVVEWLSFPRQITRKDGTTVELTSALGKKLCAPYRARLKKAEKKIAAIKRQCPPWEWCRICKPLPMSNILLD